MAAIRQFIVENFLFGQGSDTLGDHDSFLEKGIIDSTGVLELVTFLEQHFKIKILDEELTPENLDSIDRLERFVAAKQAEQRAAPATATQAARGFFNI